jgi:hypothetical protein
LSLHKVDQFGIVKAFAKQSINWNDFRERYLNKFSIKSVPLTSEPRLFYATQPGQRKTHVHPESTFKLSKYIGCHRHYKELVEEFGIKREIHRSIVKVCTKNFYYFKDSLCDCVPTATKTTKGTFTFLVKRLKKQEVREQTFTSN